MDNILYQTIYDNLNNNKNLIHKLDNTLNFDFNISKDTNDFYNNINDFLNHKKNNYKNNLNLKKRIIEINNQSYENKNKLIYLLIPLIYILLIILFVMIGAILNIYSFITVNYIILILFILYILYLIYQIIFNKETELTNEIYDLLFADFNCPANCHKKN